MTVLKYGTFDMSIAVVFVSAYSSKPHIRRRDESKEAQTIYKTTVQAVVRRRKQLKCSLM